MNNNSKRITSFLLAAVMVLCISTPVFALNDNHKGYRETTTYWTKNEEMIEKLFDMSPVLDSVYIVYDKLTINEDNYAEYELILGKELLIFEGTLYKENAIGSEYLNGTLRMTSTINGLEIGISATITKNISDDRLTVGLSIEPKNAKSLDDYSFIGFGDIITKDELNRIQDEIDCHDDLQSNSLITGNDTILQTTSDSEIVNTRGFSLKGYQYQYLSPVSAGYAEYVELWYNPSFKRATVAIKSYTNNVANYFTANDQSASACIDTLSIGLYPTTNGAHSVDGFYDFPSDANPPTNDIIFNDGYINLLITIITGYLRPSITTLALNTFQSVLSMVKNKSNASTSWLLTGSNTYVSMNYAQTLINRQFIHYNDAPMSVSFGVKAGTSGTYSFAGYSQISYFVVIVDVDTYYITTLSVTPPLATATSTNIVINNNQ